jgi:hypothetical protein
MPAARFHVIIRRPNTTDPADILWHFFAKDKIEGRVKLQEELALMSHYPYRPEVEIFDLDAA